MREGFFKSRGLAYCVSEFVPERRTLVFVHGFSGSLSAWLPYAHALSHRFNIVLYDLRGHGKSVRPKTYAEYSLAEHCVDLQKLLVHLHVSDAVLVSHSYGTLVALQYLQTKSKRVARAIMISAPYGLHRLARTHLTTSIIAHSVALTSKLGYTGHDHARVQYDPFRPSGDWTIRRIAADIRATGAQPYLWSLGHIYAARTDQQWKHVQVPTLVVHGDKDTVVPIKNARALAKLLPHGTLAVIAGANHMIPLNNQKELCDINNPVA
jgi:pimeloyl-ACP methyl ester carboxylesterase